MIKENEMYCGVGNLLQLLIVSTAIAIATAGCEHNPPNEQTANPEPTLKITGINSAQTKVEYFDNPPFQNYFYGQLNFSTKLTKQIVKGAEARSIKDWVVKLFGKEVNEFGITVTPTVDAVALPTIVLFSYSYDSSENKWTSDYVSEHVTPFVRINGNTKLEYKFSFVASNSGELPLASSFTNIVQNIGGMSPGSWAVSQLSKRSLESSAKAVDALMANLMTDTVSSEVSDHLRPGFNKERKKSYVMLDTKTDGNLAEVSASVELFNLVGSAQKLDSTGDWKTSVPKVDPYNKPKNTIYISGSNETTIGGHLYEKGFIEKIKTTTSASEFRKVCNQIIDEVQTKAGLNIFDTIWVMRNILKDDTDYQYNIELYESGCLDSTWNQLLDDMNVPLNFEPGLPVSFMQNEYTALGQYTMDPDFYSSNENIIRGLYEKKVTIRFDDSYSKSMLYGDSPYSPKEPPVEETLTKFISILSGLKTSRFCCYSNPEVGRTTDDGSVNSVEIIFRKRGEDKLVRMRSYRGSKTKYHLISFATVDVDYITKDKLQDMMTPRLEYNETYSDADSTFSVDL